MVYNELKAPSNQNNSEISPKQKQQSLSHNGKNHCTNTKIDSRSPLHAPPETFFHTVQTNPSPYPTWSNNVNVELGIQQSLTQINQQTQTGKP
jgi:hypothetical protein